MAAWLDKNAPGIDWEQELGGFAEEMKQAAISMPFLLAPGAGIELAADAFTPQAMVAGGGGADRYHQAEELQSGDKLVPEGVEGRVPYRGSLGEFVYQLVGGLRAGMGYCGAGDIEQLRQSGRFIRISAAGMTESHPHDIAITKESPNYAMEYQLES